MLSSKENKRSPEPMISVVGRYFLLFTAFIFALAPSVLKMYETSHWFRSEEDPSPSDLASDWFTVAKIPYAEAFHHDDRTLLRVYFLIIPYILSAFFLGLAHLWETQFTSKFKRSEKTPPRSYLVLRSVLEQTWQTPLFLQQFLWVPSQVTTAELFGIAAFLVVNIGTFVVRVKRSYPRGTRKLLFLVDIDEDRGKEPIPYISWEAGEIWAKTLGILAIVNFGWYLILPVGRRSVILEALGLNWERAIKYHRWIGYYTFILALGHTWLYIGVWVYGDGRERYDPDGYMIRRNLVPWGCHESDFCSDDQAFQLRINYYGFAALAFQIVMTVFSLSWFRRMHFEWFYYAHHLFIFLLFFQCLHYNGSIIYLIPGVAVYMVDKIFPLLAYRAAGTVKTRLVAPDVLEVCIPTRKQDYYGGAYIFLNVPSVSWLQWHPFSLTSAPGNNRSDDLVFHLKGAGTWTKAVIEAAANRRQGGSDLIVKIDGIYGQKVTGNLVSKDAVVLVGGGIGVTPMLSIARDMVNKASDVPVTLLWVARTITECSILADELVELVKASNGMVDVRVWVTMSQPEPHFGNAEEHTKKLLAKENLKDLSEEEQAASLVSSLFTIHNAIASQQTNSSNDEFEPSYVYDRFGFDPATNAFIMVVSIIVALSAYALTWHIGKVNEIEPQENRGLLQMFMIILWVLIFIVCVEAINRFNKRNGPLPRRSMKNTKEGIESTYSKDESEETHITLSSSHGDDEDRTILNMVRGRIGFRPDLASEFSKINTKNSDEHKGFTNVGVLACGPMAMVKTITQICNKPKSGCSWGMKQEDGSETFFSFTEEDWEW